MDEKLEIIYKLENNVQKLKLKLKKCTEENSTMAKQYQNLKQRFLEMVFLKLTFIIKMFEFAILNIFFFLV